MSVTVDRRMACGPMFLGLKEAAAVAEENECSPSLSSTSTVSSSSSIGKDSDVTDGEDCEDNEVQSAFQETTPLDSMEALEEVLPIRRGISKFYNGKSKSFTSLAEASSSSCLKDIVKPENAYTRKRRNLLAFNHLREKNRSFPRGSGMISKRPISASKSTLALAVVMSSSESISSSGSDDSNSSSCSKSPPQLPPRSHCNLASLSSHNNLPSPRQEFSPHRSFSLVDLQHQALVGEDVQGLLSFPSSTKVYHSNTVFLGGKRWQRKSELRRLKQKKLSHLDDENHVLRQKAISVSPKGNRSAFVKASTDESPTPTKLIVPFLHGLSETRRPKLTAERQQEVLSKCIKLSYIQASMEPGAENGKEGREQS